MVDDREPAARRPGGRTARVRAQVLDATVRLVARYGFAGFRYEQVAELAGVHRMTVYRNWPDREKLVAAALTRFGEQEVPVPDSGELRRDLVDMLLGLAAGLESTTGRALFQVVQGARENEEVRRTVEQVFQRRADLFGQRVDRAVERGELPPVDRRLLGDLLSGPVHLRVGRDLGPVTRADAERIVDVVLAGIRATATP
ncbi:TetR/AcrR family transcriptional regulator [Saccharothrix australiensis]|uniref:TetR family transcriptional regulator n=1 Tax=Saccharothrix australiensis TaxID=2072 RepID=A0A495W4N3_9PSEU|nr:TetR/AcrR family transcriptional regulator [Saccharothrix australiensis]RKT54758.1 TetR family transcriptional regulator [Saccharothrix australiensis]